MSEEIITRRKYLFLKQFNEGALKKEDKEAIAKYEEANKIVNGKTEKEREYNKRVFAEPVKPEEMKINFDVLLAKFKLKFKEIEGVEFDDKLLSNVETILYYFARDKRFFKCKNLSSLTKPSFNKGLLIVGSYGNGKTSTMRVLRELFNHTPLVFKSYTANKIVSTFEGYDDSTERYAYIERTKTKTAYFDDVKTEKIASNYGKYNLFKEILEERYINKAKTYITCNYKAGDETNNLEEALFEFNDKYGERVYDRLFEMFNVIEFHGKSMRV